MLGAVYKREFDEHILQSKHFKIKIDDSQAKIE